MTPLTKLDYNRQGQVFTACNQAGATVTLINTSTATGFILSNPYGSGKKLALLSASFTYSTVPTATAVVFLAQAIAPSAVAHATVTAVTVYAADGSGPAGYSIARAYSASTTPNLPAYTRAIGYSPTTPATTGGLTQRTVIDGEIILVPGSYIQTSYLGAAPVGVTEMTWIELGL
jgi:hypothetical protein